ncbi:MAG: tRNA pseudouridine(65) synthase TruC [Gammaproteobacteria bacterium]|nr:tRNA pseudouridine(65) synthase TruC [Gammaproteobacteria bacterium]
MIDHDSILYQDPDLIAVHKPAGLLVHRSMIDRHETQFAVQLVRDLIGQRVYPVHRLDKPTSGVLLFALNADVARRMGEILVTGGVQKHYLAVVRGYADEQDVIDYPLLEELDAIADRRARQDKAPQPAITAYRRLATVELPLPVGRYTTARYSLLSIEPKTGRKHQIRRHMRHIFHPIVGDTTHGDGRQNDFFRQQFNCQRLLLAAMQILFQHPVHGEALVITAPLARDFRDIIDKLGWSDIEAP